MDLASYRQESINLTASHSLTTDTHGLSYRQSTWEDGGGGGGGPVSSVLVAIVNMNMPQIQVNLYTCVLVLYAYERKKYKDHLCYCIATTKRLLSIVKLCFKLQLLAGRHRRMQRLIQVREPLHKTVNERDWVM